MAKALVKMVLPCLGLVLLSGCVTGKVGLDDTSGLALTPRAQIMADAAKELGKLHPPALTKVEVTGSDRDPLREDFAALLRRRGFAVAELPKKGAPHPKGALTVQLKLSSLDENMVFARLQMGSQSATRAYGILPYVKALAFWTVDLTGAQGEVVERASRPANYADPLPPQPNEVSAEPVQAASPVVWTNQPAEEKAQPDGHWIIYVGTLKTRQQAQFYWSHIARQHPSLRQFAHTTYKQGSGRYQLLLVGQGNPHRAQSLCRAARVHACTLSL